MATVSEPLTLWARQKTRFAEGSCLWRGNRNMAGAGNMAAPAVPHSLHWLQMAPDGGNIAGDGNIAAAAVLHSLLRLQMVLHSPHLLQMTMNSLLTLAISEYGMESSTPKQSSASTLVGTWGRRAGTAHWIGGKLARLKLHGVAALNSLPHL